METDLLPNVRGNVQTLRNLWSTKVQEEQKLLKPKPVIYKAQSQIPPPKQAIKIEIQSIDDPIIKRKPTVTFNNEKPFNIPSIDDTNDFVAFPPSPPPLPASIAFKQQAQSIATLKQSVTKMFDLDKKKPHFNNGIHHWHIARHVFRSGLIFAPSRRASDSIIPLLMKTHIAQSRSRTDSLDSNYAETPFQTLIDYIHYNNNNNNNDHKHTTTLNVKPIIKRTISDTPACVQRNKLNETIAQYERIMRHLKNYDKFMAEHPQASPVPSIRKSIDSQQNEENPPQKSSVRNRQTQSLARSVGRTFTEFVMNDLLLSSSNESRRLSTVHAASQTDLTELIQQIESLPIENTQAVLNELDIAINSLVEEAPITPNSEINVIVVNPSVIPEMPPKEKTLMQRLFEGKKTAYTPDDLHMESIRIPEELANTFEIAKRKCFFPTEQIIYASKMIKIDRRGYKQHVRILCLTSQRVYIITKKDPYPKEAVLFNDILGINCTPHKDGFICLHTRETREDRGDWIFLIDHPCEFLTQLFMTMERNHNNDHFLEIKTKFQHTRRNIATVTDECVIEARPSDTFHIAFENYDCLVIYTP